MAKRDKQSDIDFEIAFYEGVLAKRRDFVQALMAVGDLYTQKGLYAEGLAVDQKLARLRPEDPVVFYNLSCSYALLCQIDKALAAIKMAVASGYRDFDFLKEDPDLEQLRADPRFRQYFSRLQKELSSSSGKTDG